MKTIEDVTAKLEGAKKFSVLDASQCFNQVKIDTESSNLLTFNTPFGRYKYTRLAFGVKSAPEVVQCLLS